MITRRFYCILLFLCLLCMYGCNFFTTETKTENQAEINISFEEQESSEVESEMDFSQGDLYTMFEEVNNEQIEKFVYDDYNKDGIHEAFVITYEEDKYRLWYMSPTDCKIVCEQLEEVDVLNTEILSFSTKDYLLLQQSEKGLPNTLIYSVDNDNQVAQANISGKGYIHKNASGEIFLDVYKASDERIDINQTQYTTYYLYYVFDEGFKEYGAIPIGKEQFLEFQGGQDILERIYEEYSDVQLDISFLYRANHYINVNISIYDDGKVAYKNVLLSYDEQIVSYVSEDIREGKVEIAHMLNIATFPAAFKHPQNIDNR